MKQNSGAISLSKKLIFRPRAKHIESKYHFIRDYVQKGIIVLYFIPIEDQLANIFTKPLVKERFSK